MDLREIHCENVNQVTITLDYNQWQVLVLEDWTQEAGSGRGM